MNDKYRIKDHPIIHSEPSVEIKFKWNDVVLTARVGEMISSALFANGIKIFGHHHKDKSPQGLFCANGQCSQCLVIADGKPVKACMTEIKENMQVMHLDGLPNLPKFTNQPKISEIEKIEIPVLIIGGGPAGLAAAKEMGERGIKCLIVDDKNRLGGKLVLQTHRFFGSTNVVYAGTRGIDIAKNLEDEVRKLNTISIMLNSTAVAVYSDKLVGIFSENNKYVLVKPEILLITTGAREKSLVFKGNTLPGVFGAGAFQTLVNRDLVKAANRLFIIGGGNVGLIAGYHALQAGIEVVGLVEALPECGGYKVHKDKLARLGVPIYVSHTILSANGANEVDSVTIAKVDEKFKPIKGTEKSFKCDSVLIAVGLDPVNEFYAKAKEYGMKVFAAGDADEIAEASAAMISGKIKGREIARELGVENEAVPLDLYKTAEILKSKPGKTDKECLPNDESGIVPIFHCSQEIPCDPCSKVCPQDLIKIDSNDIRRTPEFVGNSADKKCIGCEKYVTICPGLAVTLVDYRKNLDHPTITIPFELQKTKLNEGDEVVILDSEGITLGKAKVTGIKSIERNDRTVLVKVNAEKNIAKKISGIRVQDEWVSKSLSESVTRIEDDIIVCRCERVSAGDIRKLIRNGYRDINEIKSVTRASMGACGGKTCISLIKRIFVEEGVSLKEVTENIKRPLFVEVPLGTFAGIKLNEK